MELFAFLVICQIIDCRYLPWVDCWSISLKNFFNFFKYNHFFSFMVFFFALCLRNHQPQGHKDSLFFFKKLLLFVLHIIGLCHFEIFVSRVKVNYFPNRCLVAASSLFIKKTILYTWISVDLLSLICIPVYVNLFLGWGFWLFSFD